MCMELTDKELMDSIEVFRDKLMRLQQMAEYSGVVDCKLPTVRSMLTKFENELNSRGLKVLKM